MSKLTAIAVDDEPKALQVVRLHADKVPFLDLVGTYTNAFEALGYLQQTPVDLIFLDIKMPDISGFDFYQSLKRKPLLIFTTAYSDHAVQSYEVDAVDYLLKPFSLARFLKACTKAYDLHRGRTEVAAPDYLFIKTGYDQVKAHFADIHYLEATGNYVTVVLADAKHLTRATITDYQAQLPPGQFVRVHRSFIVNVQHITKVERHQVTIGSAAIPVGDSFRRDLTEALRR